ncbi:hypothetical protein BFR04_05695 [Gaetbulibacter sp. 4G1]|nr:glycosyltransferase [Gaetbulibacter sp. 4G1]PIA79014.1 hypothetical protein BFR04_05695 [Gaetbulibacter sp. 4G1]
MKETLYITLPKNINFSVFEALKIHEGLFKNSNYEVLYLSRNKLIKGDNVKQINNVIKTFNFLRKKKTGVIYGITVNEVFLAYLSNVFGNKKSIIFWVQGLIDEEDFLSTNNRFRYFIFNKLFKFCLKISDKIIVVTKHMFEVLKSKYNCPISKNHIVIPCKSRVSYTGTEKIKKSLSYIGGLSKWQNVDKILAFFNELNKFNSKYNLYIATFDHEMANNLVERYVDKIYRGKTQLVNVRTEKEVAHFLSKMEYGFLLRDDILLNNVASPIKLAEYLACGVNPIISNSLKDFYKLVNKYNCGVVVNNMNLESAVQKFLNSEHSTQNAINCYNNTYELDGFNETFKRFVNEKQ